MKLGYNKEHMAKVLGRSLSISTKHSIEIANQIRKKNLNKAKSFLRDVIAFKRPLPIRIYKRDVPHQTKVGPGRFPQKASQEILSLLENVEANAQFKGLNTSDLIISKIVVNKAAKQWHYGRKRRRKMKRTNIEIIVEERKKTAKKDTKKRAKEDKK